MTIRTDVADIEIPLGTAAAVAPGTFLRLRREAARFSLDDVALMTETIPPICARERAQWLADIEAGTAPVPIGAALRLHDLLQFDWNVFVALCAIAEGIAAAAPAICRVCACSEYDPCEGGCAWAEADLCTACASKTSMDVAA